MTGRTPFGLLTLLTVLVCAPIQAQDPIGPPSGYGAQPGGFQPYQNGAGQYHGFPLTYQRASDPNPGPRTPGRPPRMIYEELPDDLGFRDGDTPLGKALTETFRHSWFRGEYLLWDVSGPGNVLLGAQTSAGVPAVANPTSAQGLQTNVTGNPTGGPLNVPIRQGLPFLRTVNGVAGTSQSPGLDDFSITNLNGFRGTYGLPFPVGELELSAFVLGTSSAAFDGTNLIQPAISANQATAVGSSVGADGNPARNAQPATFISQALLVGGVAQPYNATSSSFIDYDLSFHSKLTTSAWGSEGNFVVDGADPNSPIQLRPMLGFRYFNFRDRLDQGGQYNQADPANPTAPPTAVTRNIEASANNHLFGPQIGLRAEFTQPMFRLGVESKLTTALNTWQSNLNTANVLSSTDPGQSVIQRGTTFSPLVELKAFANVSLSKYVSAYVAYNYIFAADLNRSYNDIIYNKSATTNQSDFKLDKTYSNGNLQGLSVGFDFRY